MQHTTVVRATLIMMGILSLIMALQLSVHFLPITLGWIPSDAGALDLFLSAYAAAIGASLLWIGISGKLGAAVAGALGLSVMCAGLAIMGKISPHEVNELDRQSATTLYAVAALAFAGIAAWFRRYYIRDTQPMVWQIYVSFVAFTVLLASVGTALLLRLPNVFPLALSPAAEIVIGCSFLGSAIYFLSGLMVPVWHNACAQLWGFLAYDLVLIVPLVRDLGTIDSAHLPALVANITVLIYSGSLGIYYLLLTRETRVWGHGRYSCMAWVALMERAKGNKRRGSSRERALV